MPILPINGDANKNGWCWHDVASIPTREELTKRAYEAWRDTAFTIAKDSHPEWDELARDYRICWYAVIDALIDTGISPIYTEPQRNL